MTRQPSTRRVLPALVVVLASLTACRDEAPPARRDEAPGRVASAVIIIHGVGNQTTGYSKPIQDLLKAGSPNLHFVEVLWSDLGSVLRQAGGAGRTQEREAAERALVEEIDAAEQKALRSRTIVPGTPQDEAQIREEYAAARGYVSPIVSYEFLPGAERSRIQQRLREALDWSAKHADKTSVIAHSLGSVIAFDALHAWEGGMPPGRVVMLSTMGSPLGRRIFAGHRGRPAGRPGNVAAWLNFHSSSDPIASPLAGPYSNVEDRSVKTSILPLTAHSAYWTHGDVVGEVLKSLR